MERLSQAVFSHTGKEAAVIATITDYRRLSFKIGTVLLTGGMPMRDVEMHAHMLTEVIATSHYTAKTLRYKQQSSGRFKAERTTAHHMVLDGRKISDANARAPRLSSLVGFLQNHIKTTFLD